MRGRGDDRLLGSIVGAQSGWFGERRELGGVDSQATLFTKCRQSAKPKGPNTNQYYNGKQKDLLEL